jgi:site-specific recombinase
MNRFRGESTREVTRIEAVLVVSGSPALIRAVRDGVRRLRRADLVTCDLRDVPTRAAELRPRAIVISQDLYAFDSAEFDALARDVGAELIVVADAESPGPCQASDLSERLSNAFLRRGPVQA